MQKKNATHYRERSFNFSKDRNQVFVMLIVYLFFVSLSNSYYGLKRHWANSKDSTAIGIVLVKIKLPQSSRKSNSFSLLNRTNSKWWSKFLWIYINQTWIQSLPESFALLGDIRNFWQLGQQNQGRLESKINTYFSWNFATDWMCVPSFMAPQVNLSIAYESAVEFQMET